MWCEWHKAAIYLTFVFHIVWKSATAPPLKSHAGAPLTCTYCVLKDYLTAASELIPSVSK